MWGLIIRIVGIALLVIIVVSAVSSWFDEAGFVAGYLNTLDPDTGAVLTTSGPFTQRHVGGLEVRPTDGVIFASGGDEGSIYTLSPTGTQTFVGLTSAGGVGDLAFTPLARIHVGMADGRGSASPAALRTRAIASSSLTQASSRLRHA